MSNWLHIAATWLVDNHLQTPLFTLLLFLAFAESALFLGFVLPGETALIVGGMLAAQGVWDLGDFFAWAIIAAIVGDSVGYEVGKHFGPRIQHSWIGRRLGTTRWRVADHIFKQYGPQAVFVGRAQALLRALVPALAGMARMPYRTFLKWNAAGGIVWGGGVVVLGYAFAHSLHSLEKALKYWSFVLVAGVIFAIWQINKQIDAAMERVEESLDERLDG
jgi:membrane protein DedA with SNARE-associated domain